MTQKYPSSFPVKQPSLKKLAHNNSTKNIQTNASYILILKSPARYNINANKKAKDLKQSLPDMIISEKNYPNWISIVKLPEKFNDVIVAKIDKKKIQD